MNYKTKLILRLLVLTLCGCTQDDLCIETSRDTIITGNAYQTLFANSETDSASYSYFDSGEQILVNATGGFTLDNEVLTYSDDQWNTGYDLKWTDVSCEINVTALYPVHQDLNYTEENLYTDSLLEDVLYANKTYAAGEDIQLQFDHLFSLLTIHLEGKLQDDFQGMDIVCPAVVTEVKTASAMIVLDTDRSHTVSITKASTSGDYSVIVPPMEDMTVSATIRTSDKTYISEIGSRTFASNREYTYNVKSLEDMPGILTAADLIAFSRLISRPSLTSYNGKTLQDFGETEDGVTTYYLLKDIDFEGVDVSNLMHIGYPESSFSPFSDTFDGMGHTISNLTLVPKEGTTGLFGEVEDGGVVKNLHMKSCSATISSSTASSGNGISILVTKNNGTITNCSVEGCTISCEKNTRVGGIACINYGTILNCYVKDTKLTTGSQAIGPIAAYSTGKILNCYSSGNTLTNTTYKGGICGTSSSSTIRNCYVHNLKPSTSTYRGQIIGYTSGTSNVTNCYYPTSTSTEELIYSSSSSSSNNTSGNIKYNTSFTSSSGTPVYQLLNEWITDKAPSLYPNLTFTYWTEGNGIPATFKK